MSFGLLSSLVLAAYFEVVRPTADLPVIGRSTVYGSATELVGVLGPAGICVLPGIRLANLPSKPARRSRFAGSTMWQAYYVAVGCPFCLTMLGDGVTGKKSTGAAGTDVEVVDVATVLLRAVAKG